MVNYCNTLYFLIFLPIVALIYNLTSKRHRKKILLIASYIFFFSISNKLIVYLLLSTLSIHHFGLWLESIKKEGKEKIENASIDERKGIKLDYKKKEKNVVLFAFLLHVGTLIALKYTSFLGGNINTLLNILKINYQIPIPRILIPIGLSFYTLEAISYIVDVAREKIKPEKNLCSLALYLSFFPKMVEGPITRYDSIANDLEECNKITYKSLCFGSQRILYGLIKKIVVADRLNILVKSIFNMSDFSSGCLVFLGMVAYTIQLYFDFSGTMDVVIGSSEIFNIRLKENFRQPFFSKSISEFWTRWHISLGEWFKDYIFFPVSLSKPLKKLTTFARKHIGNHFGSLFAGAIALFLVWLSNGLWHGASWNFVFFGLYHFFLILLGNIFEPLIKKIYQKLHIDRENIFIKIIRIIKTTLLVFVGELFFRVDKLQTGINMFLVLITKFNLNCFKNSEFLNLGIDKLDYIIVIITLIFVFIISCFKEKGINIRENLKTKPKALRWFIFYILIFYLIIFGAYGMNYTPVDPMYAGF